MLDEFSRTQLLLGEDKLNCLKNSVVAVFGVGGVGGYVVEALARCGVGGFVLVDNDTVSISNINRQIIATHTTIGKFKVDVMKQRVLDINPDCKVEVKKCFYMPENAHEFDFSKFSYVVDAIDTVTAKIQIVLQAQQANVPCISSMGTGNKLDPTKFIVTDIYKTQTCPLARVMRRELKLRGVKSLKVVYSTEQPIKNNENCVKDPCNNKVVPGSVSFVPSVAGLIVASQVIKDLTYIK